MANIIGTNGKDLLKGTKGNDVLKGKRGNDTLKGKDGNDKLYDGPGNDKVYGGAGKDKFFAGPGSDDMWGGTGADQFIYKGGPLGDDRIHDFEKKDKILISKSYGFNSVKDVMDNVRSSGGSLTIDLSAGDGTEGYQVHLIKFDNMKALEDSILLIA